MKKYLLLTIISILLISCDKREIVTNRIDSIQNNITIMEYDSCEYLVSGLGYSQMMTHKGNCKFCEQRHSKQ